MKKIILILMVFINLLNADEYSNLSIKQLTNINNIQCMLVDGDTLWIGTTEGLVKRDLESKELLKVLTTDDGLPSKDIYSLLKVDDKIYVGTGDGLAILKDDKVEKVLTTDNGLPSRYIYSLLQVDDKIYVGTGDGLAILKDDKVEKVLTTDDGLPKYNNMIKSFLKIDDEIYIRTNEYLVMLKNEKVEESRYFGFAYSFLKIADKFYIGILDYGLIIFKDDNFEKILNTYNGLPSMYIYSFLQVDDKVYVGTGKGLVILKDDKIEKVLTTDDGLPSNDVKTLLKVGNEVYIGTSYGLTILKDDKMEKVLIIDDGLPDNDITALLKVDDKVYMGTYHGLAILKDNKVERVLTTNDGLPDNWILSLLKIDDKVYVGTSNGLAILKDENIEKILTTKDGLFSDWIYSLLQVDDKIYVGTYGGLAILKDENIEKILTIDDKILNSDFIDLLLQVKDKVYARVSNNIAILKDEKIVKFLPLYDVRLPNNIESILQIDDKIYIGTWQGILILKDEKIETILTTNNGLHNDYVLSLLKVYTKIYVGTDNGLAILKDDKVERVLTTDDGLPSNTIDSLLQVDDKIYVGTSAGLAILDFNNSLEKIKKEGYYILPTSGGKFKDRYEPKEEVMFKFVGYEDGEEIYNFPTKDACKIDNSIATYSKSASNLTFEQEGVVSLICSFNKEKTSYTFVVGDIDINREAKNAIIVVGRGKKEDDLKDTFIYLGDKVYKFLYSKGYKHSDIEFYSIFNKTNETDVIIDKSKFSQEDLIEAIEKTPPSKNPLLIYLIDHGVPTAIMIDEDEKIYANSLKSALEEFQNKTGRGVILVVDSCYSGSFVELFKNSQNIAVISSGTANEKVSMSPDGFSLTDEFIDNLEKNRGVKSSFEDASISYASVVNNSPQSYFSNQELEEYNFNLYHATMAVIKDYYALDIEKPQIVQLYLSVNDEALIGGAKKSTAYVIITPPQKVFINLSNESDIIEIDSKKIKLDYDENKNIFSTNYNFEKKGAYKIKYIVEDNAGDSYSSDIGTIYVGNSKEGVEFINILNVKKGWNLLSLPIDKNLSNPQNYFGGTIYTYKDNKWNKNPSIINYGEGFWLNIDKNSSYEFEGDSYKVDLNSLEGWNLLGLGETLGIESFSQFDNLFIYSNKWHSKDEIETIKQGQGLWIKK